MDKSIGSVYKTLEGTNKCSCGKTTINHTYLVWSDGLSIVDIANDPKQHQTIRVGICDCGNVFIRKTLSNEHGL